MSKERQGDPLNSTLKDVRREFKLAEQRMQIVQEHDSFPFKRLGRRLFTLGFHGLAEKIAPEEAARIRLENARKQLELAKLSEERQTTPMTPNYPNSEPQTKEPPRTFDENLTESPTHELVPAEIIEQNLEEPDEKSDPPEIDWKEWEVFNGEKPQAEVPKHKEEALLFDEEVKTVSIVKKALKGYFSIPQTNKSLNEFIVETAKQISKDTHELVIPDLKFIIKYIIDNPTGPHIKTLTGNSITFDRKNYPLKRVNPGRIPHDHYSYQFSKDLRPVVFTRGDAIFFIGIFTHNEMMQRYGIRHSD